MTDFVKVMRDWRRMCDAMTELAGDDDACRGCPLGDYGCPAIYESENRDFDFGVIERAVMAWAADHPEPVYMSWREYLEKIGEVPRLPRADFTVVGDLGKKIVQALDAPIRPDIAVKLGLEPMGTRD